MTHTENYASGEVLRLLFRQRFGEEACIERLPGAGSDRIYFRLKGKDGKNAVGTLGPDHRENECFVSLSEIFRSHGIPVPEIYAATSDMGAYLQEDLGRTDLLSYLKTPERIPLAADALRQLVRLQTIPSREWRRKVMSTPFSRRMVLWDLNYFKYDFLKPAGIPFDEERLEDDFETLSVAISKIGESLSGFMYRDFQSRNVMIKEGKPFFIDYQGGRVGPILYDVVSFLWQVKADFSEEEREALIGVYMEELAKIRAFDEAEVRRNIAMFV
ncbi:MAG: phosphotransferase, partial [Muribaculaceae bacterium]|nr:phosphotransferase [Muribaculaceae bacterium]